MYKKDFDKLSPKQRKKIVQGSIIPRPIAWVSSMNSDKTTNLAPFSYFQMTSPTLLSVSVMRRDNKMKDTSRNVLNTKEAVIHITSKDLIKEVDISSKPLGLNESEVVEAGLTLTDSVKVLTNGIAEAKIRLEVKLEHHLELKDYTNSYVETDLLIFRVIYAHIDKDVFDIDSEYILHDKLKPIARLAGPLYAEVLEVKDFVRKF